MARYEQDLQLVSRLLAGDQSAFDGFFHSYFPRLFRFVKPRVAENYDAAQEICQRALVRGVQKLGTYRGEASLLTWLCQIARHEISDHWDRNQVEAARVVRAEASDALRAAVANVPEPVDIPEARQARAEALRLVQLTLDELPANYAAMLEWKYLDGLSVAEIAARAGQSEIAVQSILARARGAFRAEFSRLAGTDLADLLTGSSSEG